MKMQNQWKRLFIGGAAALALTAGTLWAVDNVSAASPTALLNQIGIEQMAGFGGRGGYDGVGGRDGVGAPGLMGRADGKLEEHQQYLADALGITVAELQTAHETVRNTMLEQAVADGTITQEQADQIKAGERVRVPGLRMKGGPDQADAHDALLADALGITVEELDAAQSTAKDAALAAALASGDITQEQVDRMAAHQAFRDYVQEQFAGERPDATMAELIQQAVTAGAITQEQADLLSADDGHMGPGGRGHFEGRGSRGRGMHGQTAPDTQPNLENSPVDDSAADNA